MRVTAMKRSCFTLSTSPKLEDNMKSSARLAVVGIFSCILVVGCRQITQTSERNPPDTTYQVGSFEFGDNGSSREVRGASVTAAFFQGAKIVPLLGRGFLPVEYDSSRPQVVMLSQRFWQKQFGGDPRIIGTTMRLNGQTFTVIGVMPTTFGVPPGVDVWMPKSG
jgi:MacB-like periplasmic core domain